MELKRKVYNKLMAWKKESAGKTALLIEGACVKIGLNFVDNQICSDESCVCLG